MLLSISVSSEALATMETVALLFRPMNLIVMSFQVARRMLPTEQFVTFGAFNGLT